MSIKINNIDELKFEIARLTKLKNEQEDFLVTQYQLLRKKVDTPSRVLGALTSAVPGVDMVKGLFSLAGKSSRSESGEKKDWLTRALQIGLPFVLNKTLLKNAGWVKKGLVLLASETAAGQVTQDKVGSVISRLSDYIRPKKSKKKHKDVPPLEGEQDSINVGIPPESETY